jgi:hypothetical protein
MAFLAFSNLLYKVAGRAQSFVFPFPLGRRFLDFLSRRAELRMYMGISF